MDPLHVAMAMKVSVRRGPLRRGTFSWTFNSASPGTITSKDNNLFILVHELTHATGIPLQRRSLEFYGRTLQKRRFWVGEPLAMRVEEAIADAVAEAVSLTARVSIGEDYPPVKPGTRAAYYVQRKAKEALDYMLRITEE